MKKLTKTEAKRALKQGLKVKATKHHLYQLDVKS